MKANELKSFFNSVFVKLFIISLIIIGPIILFSIYTSNNSRNILLEQIEDTHKTMLKSYVNTLDSQLNSTLSFSFDMAKKLDPKTIAYSKDEASIVYAKIRVVSDFSTKLSTNNFIDCIFLYIKSSNSFITATQPSVIASDKKQLESYVSSYIHSNKSSFQTRFIYPKVKSSPVMALLSTTDDNIFIGFYVNTNSLAFKLNQVNYTNYPLHIFLDNNFQNTPYSSSDKNLFISIPSASYDLTLGELLPREYILTKLPFWQKYIIYISIFLVLLFPLLIFFLRKVVVLPLQELTKAMKIIQEGNLDYRIKSGPASNEFRIVNGTFNNMIAEVKNLKIDVYEEKIKVQRSQLRNLQLQIKPHFLINSLNMVYNFIENKDYISSKKLILFSIDYFRYMVKVDIDLVPICEEVKHIMTYLEIQKIRYKGKFDYSIQSDKLIEDALIPPMLIQNFIENSIKYAIEMSGLIHISLHIEYYEVDFTPYAKITISDTGSGYPSDILEPLNSGKKLIDPKVEHIGIYNSIQRINVLYEGKASWKFYNNPGAVSEIILPAIFHE
jgi:two-component system, sensor histidine kinase YesM